MEKLKEKLRTEFGIVFKNEELLETAFTHRSYVNEHRLSTISHNERLEFLGDAVLQLTISRYLFEKYRQKPEGELSKMRSMIVREESLAGFSRDCDFNDYVFLGKGEEQTGGRHRDTILGDLFEAFLGALYLDEGLETVEKFINQVMIPKVEQGNYERVQDYKTALQEILQVNGEVNIAYKLIAEDGPAHRRHFETVVTVDEKVIGKGQGYSKKGSEQAAAKDAINQIKGL